jgi:hypothetical protein
MIIIGVDFHPEFQQIASVGTETGEFQEKRLAHREDAETFYRALAGQKVRVGMEASDFYNWSFRARWLLSLEGFEKLRKSAETLQSAGSMHYERAPRFGRMSEFATFTLILTPSLLYTFRLGSHPRFHPLADGPQLRG